jgi:hypothetical protein
MAIAGAAARRIVAGEKFDLTAEEVMVHCGEK